MWECDSRDLVFQNSLCVPRKLGQYPGMVGVNEEVLMNPKYHKDTQGTPKGREVCRRLTLSGDLRWACRMGRVLPDGHMG